MKLADYLAQKGIRFSAFGKQIGLTGEAVRLLANGKRSPSARTSRRIFLETSGAVTPNDFLATGSDTERRSA